MVVSRALFLTAGLVALAAGVLAQPRRDVFIDNRDHPAIEYSKRPVSDAVSLLNARIRSGGVTLQFDQAAGYLRSLLEALRVPVDSQSLVFSQTSFQAALLNMRNPRAVYFNDTVAVGWVRGGEVLEVAAQDPKQGVVFYALEQKQAATPQLQRTEGCLACHLSWDTLGVPGLQIQSVQPLPDDPNAYAVGFITTHGSPLNERWGGWYVTGRHGAPRHMGNIPVMPEDARSPTIQEPLRPLDSLTGVFDLHGYPTPYSDVVAQMVLAHQTRMTNMITRLGWEARVAAAEPTPDRAARVREAVVNLVDYLLFVDEAALPAPMRGTSGFTERFSAEGPRDKQGRSLRQLDLDTRLMKFRCSYMIYSDAFSALPASARDQMYTRMWQVLSGQETSPRYGRMSRAERQAIVEILRETVKGLPAFFTAI